MMDILDECRRNGVPNLQRVRSNVLRSGQPTIQGWDFLRTLLDGRQVTVLKLNFDDEGSDNPARLLGYDVRTLSIEPRTNPDGLIHVVREVIEKPPSDVWAEIVRNIREIPVDDDGRTWLIHCVNGHDRTGLACGHIRVLVDRWPKKAAHEEMCRLGYHVELVGLERQWKELGEAT